MASFVDSPACHSTYLRKRKSIANSGLMPCLSKLHRATEPTLKEETNVMASEPTHEQGQLHLQIYDLRREAKLRQARDWYFKNYFVETFEDAMHLAGPGTESGTYAFMVLGYWEQACAYLNHGLLHEDLFFETSGEFYAVWDRVKGIVPTLRERFVERNFLGHLEKAAQRYEAWSERRSPGHITAMQFMQQMRLQTAAAATV
jgi:hypothetical protein